jgi:signal transduction histidine kinase
LYGGRKIITDEINNIFSPFFRSKYHGNTEKGYGLGPAITAKAIDVPKVKIHINYCKYTCFSLKIPRIL